MGLRPNRMRRYGVNAGIRNFLIGEFSFEAKFKRKDEFHEKAMDRCIKFFCSLQDSLANGSRWA